MTYFSLYVILNAVKNPTEELTSIYFITLVVGYFAALNMTYFSLYVILNVVKNPIEELMSIYFITLVVGYFANAQYDVLFKIYLTKASATFNPVTLSKPLKNALEFTSQTVKPFSVNKKSIPQ